MLRENSQNRAGDRQGPDLIELLGNSKEVGLYESELRRLKN